ncbi:MAG: tyrosine-type recombinase/integrase [Pseudonocardiales bacterium]|nr:tyrosine-type recombinase/integrase [Pseudonocardiales bacterium]
MIRYGKGGRYREVPLHPILRATLETWIAEAASIDVGRDAEFTPHVLRHTAGTTMTRSGTDIVVVAEILGHSMETARRYALPSPEDRHTAINRLTTDQ